MPWKYVSNDATPTEVVVLTPADARLWMQINSITGSWHDLFEHADDLPTLFPSGVIS